jgi:hypothetical protein
MLGQFAGVCDELDPLEPLDGVDEFDELEEFDEFDEVEAVVPADEELVAACAATAPPPMTAPLNASAATSLRTLPMGITSSRCCGNGNDQRNHCSAARVSVPRRQRRPRLEDDGIGVGFDRRAYRDGLFLTQLVVREAFGEVHVLVDDECVDHVLHRNRVARRQASDGRARVEREVEVALVNAERLADDVEIVLRVTPTRNVGLRIAAVVQTTGEQVDRHR